MSQQVLNGRGELNQAALRLKALGVARPLVVGGSQARRLPEALQSAPRFHGYHPNPDFSDALSGAALYRQAGCDGLLSIGGGSAMDTAKLIKALLSSDTPEDALHGRLTGALPVPHLAVPTSAGTGAEATFTAVCYVDGRKVSVAHPALLPEAVILDASLLDTLPLYHQKACAMDALCQGIESYWCSAATVESREVAINACLGVLRNLNAYLAGDAHAADAMLYASYASGVAIRQTRTTAAHAMSYQITKLLGYAHGHACMLTLPHLWRLMLRDAALSPRLNRLALALRFPGAEDAPLLLMGLLADTGMLPDRLPDEAQLTALASSVNPERLSNHPQALNASQLRAVYAAAFTPLQAEERAAALTLWRNYANAE